MTEPTRKLAAIVFTDIVGFTKLTAEDQSKASGLIKQQRGLFRPIVDSYNGTWVKEMGDGLILTFDTVTDAVNCCIKLQETSKQIDDLDLRIGIHQGEILIEENDIIGDDVNVAARIEPFSAPGGIAISNKVHDAIVRESDFTTKYLGKPKLKGVGQKVEVYCITSHGLPETILSNVSAKLEHEGFDWNVKNTIGIAASVIGLFLLINFMFLRIGFADEEETPSIAILPFENKGAETDDFYAYGISSDLIADVTSAGLIRVAGLNDIEKLEYNQMSYSELSNKLFVRYVAKGTLWKMDTLFQLSMEIFDTELSKVIYTKRWETAWKDLATIKDDLSDNILKTLKIEVLRDVENQIVESNPEAYEYYLRANHKYNKRQNLDDIEIARGMLKKAIELDENLIKAKRLLGSTYQGTGDYDKAMNIYSSVLKQAEELSDSDEIASILNNMGIVHYYRGETDAALGYWERSISIYEELGDRQGMGSVLGNMGNAYYRKGDYDMSLDYIKKGLAIDEEIDNKKGIAHYIGNIAVIHYAKGDLDKALNYLERSIGIKEEMGNKSALVGSLSNLGVLYQNEKGYYDKAMVYYERSLAISEELGDKDQIGRCLGNIGSMYSDKGDYDKALNYFERSLALSEEMGDKGMMIYNFTQIGLVHYFKKTDFELAAKYMEKSQAIIDEIGTNEEDMIYTKVFLYLTYKQLGKTYDVQEIFELLKNNQNINFPLNYGLYELLEDKSYLEKAYDQIQVLVETMEDELKEEFFNYPIQKKIIDEYKKVIS